MKFSEETLMAYADGQLDAQTRAAVDAAMAADPELARRIERHVALNKRLHAAFDPVLDEPVPERLLNAVGTALRAEERKSSAAVIDLAAQRRKRSKPPVSMWSWRQWGAIAAGIAVGVVAGRVGIPEGDRQFAMIDGGLVARGALRQALSTQLASVQAADAPVRIGISFKSRSGDYCRTFAVAKGVAGLACKGNGEWRLQVLAPSGAAPSGERYRMAGSDMPPAVVREVDAVIQGSAFDAGAEQAAREHDWRLQR